MTSLVGGVCFSFLSAAVHKARAGVFNFNATKRKKKILQTQQSPVQFFVQLVCVCSTLTLVAVC